MNFADEMKKMAKGNKCVSIEEMYADLLLDTYQSIKSLIAENVKQTGCLNGKIKGIGSFSNNYTYVTFSRGVEEGFWESGLFERSMDGDIYFAPLAKVDFQSGLFSSKLSINTTKVGERVMKDLKRLALDDGVTISFKPYFKNSKYDMELDDFNVFYTVPKSNNQSETRPQGSIYSIYYSI